MIKAIVLENKKIKGSREFLGVCKDIVTAYVNEHIDVTDNRKIMDEEVFVVWSCKALQNQKALLSTMLCDGMYYELTYNGDKDEIYLDAYKKFENRKIGIMEHSEV